MIEDLPDVPPALLLLVQELAHCSSLADSRKRVKGMLPDLRQQSEAFQAESVKRESYLRDPLRFDVHLHGALDILSNRGCAELPCRVHAAERIARSVGLIADRVWLTDHLSDKFVDFGRVTNAKLDRIIDDTLVLVQLLPLILAGIVRFRSPWIVTCSGCAEQFDLRLEDSTKSLARQFRRDFRVEPCEDGKFFVSTGKCFDPPLYFRGSTTTGEAFPKASDVAEDSIYSEIRSALWVAREAAIGGGSVFSNSRVGLAGLLHQEGLLVDRRSLLSMDKEREFNIPWVSELNAGQILQPREEAADALPLFREKMAKALSSSEQASSTSASEVIDELRVQALEVRAELVAKQANSGRFWKTTYALLGLGISAYGVGTDQLIAGVGGLLPIIQLLINHKTGCEADAAKLMSRPGFVLVKAQDILAHAH